MASTFELVVEKLKGMGEQIPGGRGWRAALLPGGNKSRRFRVSPFGSRSGLKANTMRKLLPLLIAIFVMFTHLNGEPVAINPESVSSVHPTAPGYPVGTMIDLQNGSEIVKEPFAEVVKKLETGAARNDEKIRNPTQ
jgi:uncharacterized protein YlzI (FlbEa/FlbD family)